MADPSAHHVYRITGVRRGLAEDQAERTRRYLISMGIRTGCFLGAVLAHGWLRWVLIAGAVALPYLAVVFANAGRERTGSLDPQMYFRPERSELPKQTPELPSGRIGPND
jgi:Protein of unknown function (DUF3099)